MSKSGTKRLNILSESEIESIYSRPLITYSEQREYFALPEKVRRAISNFSNNTKAFFILQSGYFSATHQFHHVEIDVMESDLKYIINNCLRVVQLSLRK